MYTMSDEVQLLAILQVQDPLVSKAMMHNYHQHNLKQGLHF